MPGLLLRALRVELAPRQEGRLDRILARAAGLAGRGRGGVGDDGRRCRRGALGLRLVELLGELLDGAQSLLAAGDAQVEALLLLQEQRVGIVGAVVAALAAILLRHGGHEARRERPLGGHLHALVESEGGVVPGRVAVVGQRRPVGGFASLAAGDGRRARRPRREEGREIARQPGALLERERGVLRDQRQGRDSVHAHAAASRTGADSARARKASSSCRSAKAWKPSSRPRRCAR